MDLPQHSFPSPLAGKKIIVSGAGIAGLAFAISLRSTWRKGMGPFPDIVHYERESGQPDHSREGYSISIRSDESSQGVQALQQMGLLDKLLDIGISRNGDERGYFGLWSLDWHRLVKVRDHVPANVPKSGIRISRMQLRQVLLEASVKYGDIKWGVACTAAIPNPDGSVRVKLTNEKEDVCDLLVVADGANSKLRAFLRPNDPLDFAGPVSISAVSHFRGPPPDPVSCDWGIVPSGKGVALFASPMGRQSANWSISYLADAPRKEYRQPMSPALCAQLLQEARERGATFQEPFQTLVKHTDPSTLMVFNAMDKRPFAHGAATDLPPNVAFIGDSNHAVSPFAGNGANMALKDGYDLAECLCSHPTIPEAFQAYDKRSLPRAATSLRTSRASITVVHSSGLMWAFYRLVLIALGYLFWIWYRCKDMFVAIQSGKVALR